MKHLVLIFALLRKNVAYFQVALLRKSVAYFLKTSKGTAKMINNEAFKGKDRSITM